MEPGASPNEQKRATGNSRFRRLWRPGGFAEVTGGFLVGFTIQSQSGWGASAGHIGINWMGENLERGGFGQCLSSDKKKPTTNGKRPAAWLPVGGAASLVPSGGEKAQAQTTPRL